MIGIAGPRGLELLEAGFGLTGLTQGPAEQEVILGFHVVGGHSSVDRDGPLIAILTGGRSRRKANRLDVAGGLLEPLLGQEGGPFPIATRVCRLAAAVGPGNTLACPHRRMAMDPSRANPARASRYPRRFRPQKRGMPSMLPGPRSPVGCADSHPSRLVPMVGRSPPDGNEVGHRLNERPAPGLLRGHRPGPSGPFLMNPTARRDLQYTLLATVVSCQLPARLHGAFRAAVQARP